MEKEDRSPLCAWGTYIPEKECFTLCVFVGAVSEQLERWPAARPRRPARPRPAACPAAAGLEPCAPAQELAASQHRWFSKDGFCVFFAEHAQNLAARHSVKLDCKSGKEQSGKSRT